MPRCDGLVPGIGLPRRRDVGVADVVLVIQSKDFVRARRDLVDSKAQGIAQLRPAAEAVGLRIAPVADIDVGRAVRSDQIELVERGAFIGPHVHPVPAFLDPDDNVLVVLIAGGPQVDAGPKILEQQPVVVGVVARSILGQRLGNVVALLDLRANLLVDLVVDLPDAGPAVDLGGGVLQPVRMGREYVEIVGPLGAPDLHVRQDELGAVIFRALQRCEVVAQVRLQGRHPSNRRERPLGAAGLVGLMDHIRLAQRVQIGRAPHAPTDRGAADEGRDNDRHQQPQDHHNDQQFGQTETALVSEMTHRPYDSEGYGTAQALDSAGCVTPGDHSPAVGGSLIAGVG